MLYREIIAVCSQIHTKHINTLCGQNAGFTLHVEQAVRSFKRGVRTCKFGSLKKKMIVLPSLVQDAIA